MWPVWSRCTHPLTSRSGLSSPVGSSTATSTIIRSWSPRSVRTIRGSCFWRIEGEDYCGLGWVENLFVEEKHRKSGLGEKLLRATISDMKEFYERAGVRLRKVILTTQVNREDARRLYEKVGFREMARLEGLYDAE